jgi:peptide/nickel transport system substrate-binding protein
MGRRVPRGWRRTQGESMMRTKKGAAIGIALGAVVSLAATACSSSSSSSSAGGASSAGSESAPAAGGSKGGTLYYQVLGPQDHWDPQRTYVGADIEFASRVFARTLTTYSAGKTAKLVPDLATDLGTMTDAGKTWKFTLRDGVKWEDGKDIACEDVKYGVSRTYAQDVITGGPNYTITFLDIPTKKNAKGDTVPAYEGPYTKVGQDLFDKAVTCEGKTITFHFKTAWTDFNVANAALLAWAPFRADKDQGDKSDLAVFSSGPYKLEGVFDRDKGGKFVRNTSWDAATDEVRKANPDIIQYDLGIQTETTYQRLIADSGNDKTMVAGAQAAASTLPLIAGNAKAKERSVNVAAPYVDYIQPNVKSKAFTNPKAREAFAVATSRDGYIAAHGGAQAMIPTYAMCNKELACFKDFNPFGAPSAGDPVAAKKILTDAGIATPVNITVVYRSNPTRDKALSAMKATWDQGGFNVTLEPLTTKYYSTIQSPAYATKDAFWAGWAQDWPSGSTVLPPLFDSRPNITAGGSGQDYGYFQDDAINKKIDETYAIADPAAREKAWGDIDEMISKAGGVIPLVNQKFTFMYGSGVKNYETNPQIGGYVDLANIAVK